MHNRVSFQNYGIRQFMKNAAKENTEAIAGISGVQSVFLHAQLQFKQYLGQENRRLKKKKERGKKRVLTFRFFTATETKLMFLPSPPTPNTIVLFSFCSSAYINEYGPCILKRSKTYKAEHFFKKQKPNGRTSNFSFILLFRC